MSYYPQNADNASRGQASILIVDDQPENLELLVQILRAEGHLPRPALNAQVALGAVKHTRPDLILLDIRMPEIDGFELCLKFKSNPSIADVPIIFISALEDVDEKIKAFQVGGIDYITRPFQEEEVLARVRTHLELSRMRYQMESLVRERTQDLYERTRQLAEEVETRLELIQKVEAIGTLSGGIAHVFNNMLSIIIGNTELAMEELPSEHTVQANLDEIRLATLRAKDVVKQLVDFSQARDSQRYLMNLYDQTQNTLNRYDEDSIPTGNERILYIDDEHAITKSAQSTLGRLGYDVTALNDPGLALSLFKSDPTRYDLVITDMTMPKLTGDDLSKEMLKVRNDVPIIICTGHNDKLDAQRALEIGIRHYANKPLAKSEIARLIRSVLDREDT